MKNTQNKGITLIALVITIIVMLILVGVTINLSLNGGLFGYAKQAVSETNKALTEEEMLANGMVKVGETWYSSIEEYLSNPTIVENTGDWDYIYNEDGRITLTKYNGSATELVVPNRYYPNEKAKQNGEQLIVSKVQSGEIKLKYNKTYDYNTVEGAGSGIAYNIIGEVTNDFTSNITEVTISDGVEIGPMAFWGMTSLETVTIGKNIKRIDSYAFFRDTKITEVNIGEDVKIIGQQCFQQCTDLATLNFKNIASLEIIGPMAFCSMTSLKNLDLNNAISLTTILTGAFMSSGLEGELVIPSNVKEIWKVAFSGCKGLTSLDLSKATSLTKIESKAFYNCTGLTGEVEIPSNVTVADDAFDGTNLTLSKTIANKAYYNRTDLTGELEIASNVTTIGRSAFNGCSNLTSLNLSNATSLETIGSFAFNNCKGIKGKLIIPSSVKQIGNAAFQYCTGFTGIELNEGLKYIGSFAFNHSGSYTGTITIPSTVKQIGGSTYTYPGNANIYGSHIFYDCGNYTAFEVAEGNEAYKAVNGVLYSKDGTRLVAYPQGKTGDTYEIPEGVTTIDELALGKKTYLKKIILPDSYEIKTTDEMPEGDYKINVGNNLSIGIYQWGKVESVEVKETNTKYKSENGMVLSKNGEILYYVPTRNSEGGTLTIPSTVKTIYKGAIYGCGTNKSVTNDYKASKIIIPAGCTSIDETDIAVINKGTWEIEVEEGNENYTVTNGKLVTK